MTPYILILVATLIVSPFAVTFAQKQDKKTKSRLKNIFLLILVSQTILGLQNWKQLSPFLIVFLIQIFLLTRKTPAETPVVLLNFINTIIYWGTMIRLDQKQIDNPTNLAAITNASFSPRETYLLSSSLSFPSRRFWPFFLEQQFQKDRHRQSICPTRSFRISTHHPQ